jgi:hypothetical protein
MALQFILVAVAHQRHPTLAREPLYQTQRKLLAMVLNDSAPLVDWPIQEKLFSILL